MRTAVLILLVLAMLILPACQMNERLSGTVFGALGGAGIGALAGGWAGAGIGLVAGGVAGYIVGDYLSDKRECGRCGIFPPSKCGPPACPPACAPAPCAYTQPVAQCAPAVRGIKERAINPAARDAYRRGRAALTATVARTHFERSIQLDPQRPEPYNALGLNYLYAGDRAGAERLFRQAVQLDPGYYAATYNLKRLEGNVTAAR